MTGRTGIHLGQSGVIALAAFAVGLPAMLVILMARNVPIWPDVPVLLVSWVIVMLIVRGFIQYKIDMSTFRKQRELARQEIGRLEARVDEAQRKSGDKN